MNTYYKSCTKCGRPQTLCKGDCCNKPNCGGCQCREYGCRHNACIREKNPECPYTAVIPSVTVENISGINNLADCFVHVDNINTTFYIDDKHRMMTIWAGPIEIPLPESIQTRQELNAYILSNPRGLRGQTAYYTFKDIVYGTPYIDAFYYDYNGEPWFAGEFEKITEE